MGKLEHEPKIGSARLINIKVIKDDKDVIYEGKIEEASEQIKNLVYSSVELDGKVVIFRVDSSNIKNKDILK